tara:strand:+ start:4523 stop:5545 length:1023 start_codon:yes stop_codon:yes gene_type:complete
MIIYIQGQMQFAGKPIYEGFATAWAQIGYEVRYYDELFHIEDCGSKYEIMMTDSYLGQLANWSLEHNENSLLLPHHLNGPQRAAYRARFDKARRAIDNSSKTYCFSQPTTFPLPWGAHNNFVSFLSAYDAVRNTLNDSDHVKTWTWVDQTEVSRHEYYKGWKEMHTIPLAFDHLSYNRALKAASSSPVYDLCYVGGWANNGFDEKRRIMVEHFRALSKTNLKCGIFINKNISVEKEAAVLYNSKVALNIHDEYQRVLGLDSNERTFKSLGLTGALVCDNIGQVNRLFPDLPLYDSPEQMVEQIMNLIDDTKKLTEQKEYYRNLLLKEHTYVHRVEQMRDL